MTRPSNEQRDFAKSMNARQRRILRALADSPHFMSASEVSDAEVRALFKARLVRSYQTNPVTGGPWLWGATDIGKALSKRLEAGTL